MPTTNESITAPAVGHVPPAPRSPSAMGGKPPRLRVAGKFLFAGEEKFYIRGVTYGPFRPDDSGGEFPAPTLVARDFAQMAASGINAVRTYTVPPEWLLDAAQKHNLRVLVGLPWEQHITFLDSPRLARDLERRARAAARACAGHPALLALAIGNEIPSPIVRWYGHRRIEKFLERLYRAVKSEDPEMLVTYVNYPSTEYLELPFLDFVSFNVYLESQDKLQAYLARLQNLAGERPLVMAEVGLDSLRHGETAQAVALEWQVRTAFANGCAGLFVFSWTDEWFRGGSDIEDWKFGLTTRTREPKPALEAVRHAYRNVPFAPDDSWPLISVVICTFNGARTLRQTLKALQRVNYPKWETIVVDDGSTDATAALAREFPVRLIRQPNLGLSAARNTGWRAAQGEIVAYLDDDAAPDPHWLQYLASVFMANAPSADSKKAGDAGCYAGAGGPNIAFPEDNFLAHCVDHAPGNPTHVLLTDLEAEHLPGCNMAYRRACLEAIGGFDPQFRVAGDDVDLCWRLQQRGWKLGFHPGAMVWHHRRSSLRGYWRQQLNYGRAEAMLERKWPEKYNAAGHLTWNGRLYGKGFWSRTTRFHWNRRRIYHGRWGTALFQSVYAEPPGLLAALLMMPEWYLLMALMAVISLAGMFYPPLRCGFVLLAAAFVPPALHAGLCGQRTFFRLEPQNRSTRWRFVLMTALLHFLQPAARLIGRLQQGLTPWRKRGSNRMIFPAPKSIAIWSETTWRSAEQRLQALELAMRESGAVVVRGGDFDAWDLEVRGGLFGNARATLVIEEHGHRRQLVRLRAWPTVWPAGLVAATLLAALATLAAVDMTWGVWALLDAPALLLLARTFYEAGIALAVVINAVPATLADGEKIVKAPAAGAPAGAEK
ncbi:MAG TPA: glycosyltransferase [Verrucomicrobiae bacterium]|nr:glycosyltransferase [Verrucomicrobiae bacterium]